MPPTHSSKRRHGHIELSMNECPLCGESGECIAIRASGREGDSPIKGDIVSCGKCGESIVIGEKFTYRIITNKEWKDLKYDDKIRLVTLRTRIRGYE